MRPHVELLIPILLVGVLLLSPGRIAPQMAPPMPADALDLNDLLHLVEEHNPEIAVARDSARATDGALRQAGLLPNPSLRLMEEDVPLEGVELDRGRTTAAVAQPLAIGGRIGAARATERARLEAATHRLHDIRHAAFLRVEELYIRILWLGEAERLQWRQITRAEEVQRLYDDGGGADAARARSALAETRLGLIRVATEAQVTMRDLRAELNGLAINRGQITGTLASRIDAEYVAFPTDAALARHPALLAAQARTETARNSVELARRERVPDLTVLAGGGWNAAMDESFGEVGVEMPIPLFDRRQGRIAQARAESDAAAQESQAVREGLRADIDRQLMLLNEFDTLVSDSATELVPPATDVYTSLVGADAPDGVAVVDAMRTLHRLEQEELAYRRDLNLAMARLRHYLLAEPR